MSLPVTPKAGCLRKHPSESLVDLERKNKQTYVFPALSSPTLPCTFAFPAFTVSQRLVLPVFFFTGCGSVVSMDLPLALRLTWFSLAEITASASCWQIVRPWTFQQQSLCCYCWCHCHCHYCHHCKATSKMRAYQATQRLRRPKLKNTATS